MIDGLKFYSKIDDVDTWKSSVSLQFLTLVNTKSGEIGEFENVGAGFLRQTITEQGRLSHFNLILKQVINFYNNEVISAYGTLIVKGSLHKNYCKGHNYSDFAFSQIKTEIAWLSEMLNISPENLIITNIEFGLNIDFHTPVFDFLSENLVIYKSHQFNKYAPDRRGNSIGYYCPLKQYSLKLYDKAKQYGIKKNIFRIELRYIKMAPLKKTGIRSLKDLENPDNLISLFLKLNLAWSSVLIFDHTSLSEGNSSSIITPEFISNAKHSKFWEQLKKNSSKLYFYSRRKFVKYLDSQSNTCQRDIQIRMNEKFDYLISH